MDKKGFATSAILYTILLLFLVLMIGILNNLQNKKTILDQLKIEVLSSMEVADTIDTENPQASVSLQSATAYITMTDNTGVFGYAIVASGEEPAEWTRTEILKIVTIKWSIPQAGTYSVWVKDIYENVSHTEFTIKNSEFCAYQPGDVVKTFEYTGSIEEFSIPCSGIYKLEVFGAQGGSYSTSCAGGTGGYSTGNISLNEGENLYIVVGGQGTGNGTHTTRVGGFNGGGTATIDSDGNTRQSSGGGATHIAKATGLLSSLTVEDIMIVSGGGGGGSGNSAIMCTSGGTGGGLSGGAGGTYREPAPNIIGTALGGTQTSGGSVTCQNVGSKYCAVGSFGLGASSTFAGGGGGFYGGSVATTSAGGGSGYISPNFIEGTTETKNGVRSGNGYAKITLISLTD